MWRAFRTLRTCYNISEPSWWIWFSAGGITLQNRKRCRWQDIRRGGVWDEYRTVGIVVRGRIVKILRQCAALKFAYIWPRGCGRHIWTSFHEKNKKRYFSLCFYQIQNKYNAKTCCSDSRTKLNLRSYNEQTYACADSSRKFMQVWRKSDYLWTRN